MIQNTDTEKYFPKYRSKFKCMYIPQDKLQKQKWRQIPRMCFFAPQSLKHEFMTQWLNTCNILTSWHRDITLEHDIMRFQLHTWNITSYLASSQAQQGSFTRGSSSSSWRQSVFPLANFRQVSTSKYIQCMMTDYRQVQTITQFLSYT